MKTKPLAIAATYAVMRMCQYAPAIGSARAQMLQSITNDKPAAAVCSDSPVFLTTVGIGTWTNTFSASCGQMVAETIGAGARAASSGNGGRGGGYGKKNGITLSPSQLFKFQVGKDSLTNSERDTFICNGTLNCAGIAGSAVLAGGTGGSSGAANVGDTVFNGGAGGTYFYVAAGDYRGGGGGGAAGPNGAGAAGGNGSAPAGGTGGQGDNSTGGTGGTGVASGSGNPGNNGTEMGSGKGSGGGGGGSGGAASTVGGNGGAYGAGKGGMDNTAAGAGTGLIKLTPSTFNLIGERLPSVAAVQNLTFGSGGTVSSG